jgi:hypothetical protein
MIGTGIVNDILFKNIVLKKLALNKIANTKTNPVDNLRNKTHLGTNENLKTLVK